MLALPAQGMSLMYVPGSLVQRCLIDTELVYQAPLIARMLSGSRIFLITALFPMHTPVALVNLTRGFIYIYKTARTFNQEKEKGGACLRRRRHVGIHSSEARSS